MIKGNKTVLITGASKGIGKEIAKSLIKNNFQVIGISRTHSIKDKNYMGFVKDLTNLKDYNKLLLEIKKKYTNIIAVISNAGSGIFKNLENFSEKDIGEFINLNLISHIILSKAFINYFKTNNNGYFIFNGSEAVNKGGKKATLYCSAKHGLLGLAKSLRLECNNDGIRVSIINAGMVKSNFFQKLDFEPGINSENYINTKDLANLVLFLLKSNKNINYFDINLDPLKKVIKFKKKKSK